MEVIDQFTYFKDYFGSRKVKKLEMKARVRAERSVRNLLCSCTNEAMAWAEEAGERHRWSLVRR